MQVDNQAFEGILGERERQEVRKIISGDQVAGYAVFDQDGAAVKKSGVSENAVAVFSNLMDISEQIGTELGESAPRPAMMFSGPGIELLALPLNSANLLVIKDKSAGGQRKELRNAN